MMKRIMDLFDNVLAVVPLGFMVAYSIYQLLVVNIEGNGKIACVIGLMASWGILFSFLFVKYLSTAGKSAIAEE